MAIEDALHRNDHMTGARLHRRQLQRGVEADAGLDKPSGSVVQTMFDDTRKVEYMHPVALLYYLCTICEGFRASMGQAESVAVNNVCRVVLDKEAAATGCHRGEFRFGAFFHVLALRCLHDGITLSTYV